MELSEFKKDSYDFTKITSDLVRQFAFAGIAVIWIFKNDKSSPFLIPTELFNPLLFLVITLVFDLLQYLFPSIIWTLFFLYYEKKHNGNTKVKVKANKGLSAPGWICYFGKITTLIIAYSLLICYPLKKI
jgi:multisubunit Na+/H+ antiporter MnhB subunit